MKYFLQSQVDKDWHFCLIGIFSLRCAATSFSCFAQKISTISHSLNLLFPSFEAKIFQLRWLDPAFLGGTILLWSFLVSPPLLLYCRLIYMLSILCVRLTIKVKVGIPESFKVGWYRLKKTGSSHLKAGLSSEFSEFFFLAKHLLESFLICSFVCLGFLRQPSHLVPGHNANFVAILPMRRTKGCHRKLLCNFIIRWK